MAVSGYTAVLNKMIITMKIKAAFNILFLSVLTMFFSCKNDKNNNVKQYKITQDTSISISVDESFKPVIEEMQKVFESSFPNEHLTIVYKPEGECLRDLQNDSTRMIIIGRGLTSEENKIIAGQLSFTPFWDKVAYDAVAVIVNKTSNDTLITIKELQERLTGKLTDKQIVLDGKNTTSTVKYVLDSVARAPKFSSNVVAADSTEQLINIIAQTPGAIGMLGFSWINDNDDPAKKARLQKIKVVKVKCNLCTGEIYAAPSANTITEGQYTLIRQINFVVKENGDGLGTKFANFMSLERGQLIFRRAHLVPARMQFNVRATNISTK